MGAMPTKRRTFHEVRELSKRGTLFRELGYLCVVLLSVPLFARDACASQSPSIMINWNVDPDTLVAYPTLEGLEDLSQKRSRNPTSDAEDGVAGENSGLGVELNCTKDSLSHFDFEEMKGRLLQQLVQDIGLPCKACAEKSDYVSALKKETPLLSVRSLKNMIAVRGYTCHVCKTKNDLVKSALRVIHFPPKTLSLPMFVLPFLAFPGVKGFINVFEPRYKLLIRRALKGDKRFGILHPDGLIGSVVKILDYEKRRDGTYLVKIVGEQRFTVESTSVEAVDKLGEHPGLVHANVTLFVDAPVGGNEAKALHLAAKQVRRSFFLVDTDADAEARQDALLGHPPSESQGPEMLSHWMAAALALPPHVRGNMFQTTNTYRRLEMCASWLGGKIIAQMNSNEAGSGAHR